MLAIRLPPGAGTSFPPAVDDSAGAYRWLLDEGWPPTRSSVDDSTGGALVLSVIAELRERDVPLRAGGAPMSPRTDLELVGETMTPATGDPLTIEASPARWNCSTSTVRTTPRAPCGRRSTPT